MSSCKSKQSASRSRSRMTAASQLSVLNKSLEADTTRTYTVTHTNGYTFIKETQTITEYDTSQPHNPVAKKTETEKNTFQGVQTDRHQEQSEGKRTRSDVGASFTGAQEHDNQTSSESSSVPLAEKGIKWYVIGGIITAVFALVAACRARRKRKNTDSPSPLERGRGV